MSVEMLDSKLIVEAYVDGLTTERRAFDDLAAFLAWFEPRMEAGEFGEPEPEEPL